MVCKQAEALQECSGCAANGLRLHLHVLLLTWDGTYRGLGIHCIGIQRLRYLSPSPLRPTHTIPLVQHPNGRIPNLQHLTLFHPNLDPLQETLSLGLRSQWLIFCKLVL